MDITRTLATVAHIPFLFEDPEERAYGGVAWRRGQGIEHFRRGGLPFGMENIHDLAFAASKLLVDIHAGVLRN